MKEGHKLEAKVSTLLHWIDPMQEVARMATPHEDLYQAVDLWVRDNPVQLTTISDRVKLYSKAKVAFQSMPKANCRWVVSMPAHISTPQLVQVLKTIACSKKPGDRVITVH